ncbi:MAG: AEC family transporter [Rhodospirillales bacterium]
MIVELLSIMVPVLIPMGLGFVWGLRGVRFDHEMVTDLVTNIAAPGLVFFTLANLTVSRDLLATMVAATVATALVTGIVGAGILRLCRLPLRPFVSVLVFPNTGNVGLPLSLLAFGDAGLTLAIAVFVVFVVGQFTIGIGMASGRVSLRYLARMPLIWAVIAALVFLLTGTKPPRWLNSTAELLGDMSIPLMLITLGVSLAGLSVGDLGRSLLLAVLRFGLGFLAGLAVAYAFGLDGHARGVLILQSSMPTAVFNALLAQRYGTRPEQVAGAVTVSTLLGLGVMPLVLIYIM